MRSRSQERGWFFHANVQMVEQMMLSRSASVKTAERSTIHILVSHSNIHSQQPISKPSHVVDVWSANRAITNKIKEPSWLFYFVKKILFTMLRIRTHNWELWIIFLFEIVIISGNPSSSPSFVLDILKSLCPRRSNAPWSARINKEWMVHRFISTWYGVKPSFSNILVMRLSQAGSHSRVLIVINNVCVKRFVDARSHSSDWIFDKMRF